MDETNLMPLDDSRLERIMGRLLQTGVLAAGALMLIGGFTYLLRHGAESPRYRSFHHSSAGDYRILNSAVLLMIATPVLRVACAVLGFALERDWLYTGISLVVLALLAFALFG